MNCARMLAETAPAYNAHNAPRASNNAQRAPGTECLEGSDLRGWRSNGARASRAGPPPMRPHCEAA
eukprot:7730488-Lingulodinium_polyedra.AAC.1